MDNKENRLLTSELLEALASYPLYAQEHKHLPDLMAVLQFINKILSKTSRRTGMHYTYILCKGKLTRQPR